MWLGTPGTGGKPFYSRQVRVAEDLTVELEGGPDPVRTLWFESKGPGTLLLLQVLLRAL